MIPFFKQRALARKERNEVAQQQLIASIEANIAQCKYSEAHTQIIDALVSAGQKEEIIALSGKLSNAIRSKCIDLACNKATDGSPQAVALEQLLTQVNKISGQGIYA